MSGRYLGKYGIRGSGCRLKNCSIPDKPLFGGRDLKNNDVNFIAVGFWPAVNVEFRKKVVLNSFDHAEQKKMYYKAAHFYFGNK